MPVILGPTGVGKSQAAFDVARAIGGEIVVCDSRQVYDRLDIATNKPSAEQMAAVRYHLVGIADPAASFNVFSFVQAANAAIEDIARRGRRPVVEGGSNLWADALMDGFTLSGVPPNPARRAELEELSLDELVKRLRALDPRTGVDERNRVRLVRAVEVLETAGPPLERLRRRVPPAWLPVRIGLAAELSVIDGRLAERSRQQLERGLVEETREALASGVPAGALVLSGIGYVEAVGFLRGEIELEQLPEAMARSNRRYARRQLRWLRRDPRVTWFDAEQDPVPRILQFLRERPN